MVEKRKVRMPKKTGRITATQARCAVLQVLLTKANKRVAEYERGINYAILLGDFRRKATPSQLLADVLRILKALKDKTLKEDE